MELRLHVEHGDHVSGAVPEHHHVFGELVLIRDVRGTLMVDSREHPLSSGNVICIASERIHDCHGLKDVRVTSVTFDPVRYLRSVRELAGLSASSMLFGRDWVSPTPDGEQGLKSCVGLCGEAWSSLADAACVPRSSVQRVFRKEVGYASMEYVMRRRTEHARELRPRTRTSVTYIAECVGFMDSNRLRRRFGRDPGVPRIVYRKYSSSSAAKGPSERVKKIPT